MSSIANSLYGDKPLDVITRTQTGRGRWTNLFPAIMVSLSKLEARVAVSFVRQFGNKITIFRNKITQRTNYPKNLKLQRIIDETVYPYFHAESRNIGKESRFILGLITYAQIIPLFIHFFRHLVKKLRKKCFEEITTYVSVYLRTFAQLGAIVVISTVGGCDICSRIVISCIIRYFFSTFRENDRIYIWRQDNSRPSRPDASRVSLIQRSFLLRVYYIRRILAKNKQRYFSGKKSSRNRATYPLTGTCRRNSQKVWTAFTFRFVPSRSLPCRWFCRVVPPFLVSSESTRPSAEVEAGQPPATAAEVRERRLKPIRRIRRLGKRPGIKHLIDAEASISHA